jgi:broad specificity phosphatase PhoE
MGRYGSGPMATTIVLARHAESDWNRAQRWQGHADRPLTQLGRRQARALAERLRSFPPTAVYSSDLRRARETAEIVAGRLALPVALEPRLREIDVGEWEGLTTADAELRYPEGARRRSEGGTGWLEGESYEALGARSLAALQAIASAHPGERVLVVSHGGPMRVAWLASAGADETRPRYGNCAVEEFELGSGRIRRIHSGERGGLHQQVQG